MATLSTYVPKPKIWTWCRIIPFHILILLQKFCTYLLKIWILYFSWESYPEKSRLDALWYQSGSHQKNRNYSRYYRRRFNTEIGHTKREWRSWSNWRITTEGQLPPLETEGMSQRDGITGTRGVLVNVQHQALWKTTKLVGEFMWCKYPGRADFKLQLGR